MDSHITIPLEGFPEEGLCLDGELDSSILALEDGSLQSSAPIRYRLHAQLFDTELVVRGSVEAPFSMRCDRCLSVFAHTVRVDELALSFEVGDEPTIDITESLREELVLALPAYPKCELADKECQILDINSDFRLDKAPLSGVNSAAPSGESVWDALDQLPNARPRE